MRVLASVFLSLFFLSGCSGATDKPTDSSGDSADSGGDTGAGAENWCAVLSLVNTNCVSCHSTSSHLGDLDLQTDPYDTLMAQESAYAGRALVVPIHSDQSFLYLKMTGAQTGSEGTVMPSSGQLLASSTDLVRLWIDSGASSSCTNPDTGGGPVTFHPTGYDDPAAHGMDAKYQVLACVECHGADLAGGDVAVSCDTCHESNWRTDCTWCHGDPDNTTGAPPVDINNSATGISFPEHTTHITSDLHATWECVQCHTTPHDVLSAAHLFLGDTTPGITEVLFTGGLSPSGRYDGGGSCSNLYCHGTGQSGAVGTVASGATESCHLCHGDATSTRGMSGAHTTHLGREVGAECGDCHEDARGSTAIDNAAIHVDGNIDVALPSGITFDSRSHTCTGTCHDERHGGRS